MVLRRWAGAAAPELEEKLDVVGYGFFILVALSEIGLRNATMLPENAAALVGAGVLTVIILPTIAVAIHSPGAVRQARSG